MWHPLWQIAALVAPALAIVLLVLVGPKVIEELRVRRVRREIRDMLARRSVTIRIPLEPIPHHVATVVPIRKRRVH
jgi:hypothetical protein